MNVLHIFIFGYLLFFFLFLAWGVQRLDVGSKFPDQGWNMSLCGKMCRVWTRRPPPTWGNSLLDVFFLENQQLVSSIQLARKNSRNERHYWLVIVFSSLCLWGNDHKHTSQSREKSVHVRTPETVQPLVKKISWDELWIKDRQASGRPWALATSSRRGEVTRRKIPQG